MSFTIVAIDDQQLVLLSLQKFFTSLGYHIHTANNGCEGIMLIQEINPDIILLDINMDGMSGIEVISQIRNQSLSSAPIMIVSGDVKEKTILESFELGVVDFMKKPISLDEIAARVKLNLGIGNHPKPRTINHKETKVIHSQSVGIVIPCFNEANRLDVDAFVRFTDQNLGYHLCFVDDGSSDKTVEVLTGLKAGRTDQITVLRLLKNQGKAAAVRHGMLFLKQHMELDYLGYLDADLSTDFSDFKLLVNTISENDYTIVCGSRIERVGASISKNGIRKMIGCMLNLFIRSLLMMRFNDTQCGAKVIHRSAIGLLFGKPFISKWLFDVELFLRLRKRFGLSKVNTIVYEQPLKRWEHVDGSKISLKDSGTILLQILKVALHYKRHHLSYVSAPIITPSKEVVVVP